MKLSRFTDSQIMQILKQAEAGVLAPELCREHGMSSATFYKWRAKYGGTIKRTGRRKPSLKKDGCRSAIASRCTQGGHGKKVVKPSSRREMALSAVMLSKAQTSHLSIRAACVAFSISETCYRYQPKHSLENDAIADWLVRLTHNQRNWGFGLCFLYLRNVVVN